MASAPGLKPVGMTSTEWVSSTSTGPARSAGSRVLACSLGFLRGGVTGRRLVRAVGGRWLLRDGYAVDPQRPVTVSRLGPGLDPVALVVSALNEPAGACGEVGRSVEPDVDRLRGSGHG